MKKSSGVDIVLLNLINTKIDMMLCLMDKENMYLKLKIKVVKENGLMVYQKESSNMKLLINLEINIQKVLILINSKIYLILI